MWDWSHILISLEMVCCPFGSDTQAPWSHLNELHLKLLHWPNYSWRYRFYGGNGPLKRCIHFLIGLNNANQYFAVYYMQPIKTAVYEDLCENRYLVPINDVIVSDSTPISIQIAWQTFKFVYFVSKSYSQAFCLSVIIANRHWLQYVFLKSNSNIAFILDRALNQNVKNIYNSHQKHNTWMV